MFKDAAPIPCIGIALVSERRFEQLRFHSFVVIKRSESTSSNAVDESDVDSASDWFGLRSKSVMVSALDT